MLNCGLQHFPLGPTPEILVPQERDGAQAFFKKFSQGVLWAPKLENYWSKQLKTPLKVVTFKSGTAGECRWFILTVADSFARMYH